MVVACACSIGAELTSELPETFAPRGFKTGHLACFPALSYDLTYTDNATRVTRHAQQDFLSEYAGCLSPRFQPDENVTLSASYEFGWHDYVRNTAKHYLSHRASGEFRVTNAFIEGLSFSAGDSYLQTGNTSALENQILAFTRYDTNTAFAKTQYEFNRFSVSGKYAYSLTDYFRRADASSDDHTNSGEVEGAYKFLPGRLSIFGTYNFTRTAFDIVPLQDFDTHTVMVGVRGTYSKLDYAVSAGYSAALNVNRHGENNGPAFEAALAYAPHKRLLTSVVASRRFVAGVLTGISTDTNLKAAVTVRLTRRGRLSFDYTRNDSRYLIGSTQLSLAYTTSLEYKLTRYAAATVSYARTEREAPAGTTVFLINEGHLGMRLAW